MGALGAWDSRLKANLVGTRLGHALERARWIAAAPARRRHPELWNVYLEPWRLHFVLRSLVRRGSNCLDGGCHVGSMLAEMVELAPDGRHIAVEPVLAKAKAVSRRFPSVRMVHGALGETTGAATLHDDGSGYASMQPLRKRRGTTQFDDTKHLPTWTVGMHTIDELVGAERLDVLKLDVEGAELPALRGAKNVLSRRSTSIIFECGPEEVLKAFDYSRRDIYSFLDELGYDVYGVVDFMYGREPVGASEFARVATYPFPGFNYVAVPAGTPTRRLIPFGAEEPVFVH
jgi:FkbM family methyltransferase